MVSGRRKLALVGRSLVALGLPGGSVVAPPLPETRFLVSAVEAENARARVLAEQVESGGVSRFLDMLLRIERARLERSGA